MKLIKKRAYARAGLLGNPSDGYHGKTISLILRNFYAEVTLYDWPKVEIIPSQHDHTCFDSVFDLARDVQLHGYYGGMRLIKATIKRFLEYCDDKHPLHPGTFSIRYESNIPRQVGMAGSSAIIVATLRALMEFYQVEIPLDVQPSLALSVETRELGIGAGLQDRVVQVFEGLVYMDFSQETSYQSDGMECGAYERLEIPLLPQLYVAYGADVGEPTEVFHNNLRARYDLGESAVLDAMEQFAAIAEQGRQALLAADFAQLSALIDANFDTRSRICRLPDRHVAMVRTARAAGASAKFCGSGGAIIGCFRDEAMYAELVRRLGTLDCRVIRPIV